MSFNPYSLASVKAAIFRAALVGLLAAPAWATVSFQTSGTSSDGTPVAFEADLSISGDILTVVLSNDSTVGTRGPNDCLSAFYFDILGPGDTRPVLNYASAFGEVYLGSRTNPDTLQAADFNLKATLANDDGWQFKIMTASFTPFLAFGLGTVGNHDLAPNNFDGLVTGDVDFSIIKGDVTTRNLEGTLLVRNQATFTFTGLAGFTEANIVNRVAFGRGTAPDGLMTAVPEPNAFVLMALGLLWLGLRKHAGLGGTLRGAVFSTSKRDRLCRANRFTRLDDARYGQLQTSGKRRR